MARKSFSRAVFIILWCPPCLAQAPQNDVRITVRFDTSAADAVLAQFEKDVVTRSDVEALLEIPAVRQTISQTRRFDSGATRDAFATSLLAIANGEEPDNDPFNFTYVRDRIDEIRRGHARLLENRETIAADTSRRIAPYTPDGLAIDATVFVVLGGTSDGWAPGDGNVYLALQYFREDIDGLMAMATHELYHVAQTLFFKKSEADTDAASQLLEATLVEGTATLVGNPLAFEGDGRYLTFLKDKQQRNLRRIRENFALFEALYFRLAKDPAARFGDVYNLGFSGGWDSPLYFVGFEIAAALQQHLGRKKLVDALQNKSAAEVFALYISVYKQHNDPNLVQFSPPIEKMLLQ